MKITNYFILIKLNIIIIIIIAIECIKLSSEATTKEKLSSKSNSQIKSEMNLKANTNLSAMHKTSAYSTSQKMEMNLKERLFLTKTSSESSLTTKNCSPLCSQCSQNDLSFCTICQTGMILYNFNCFVTCPHGTYLNQETRTCQLCHNDCPMCWGPDKDMCGNTFGVRTKVVSLEDEIIEYFNSHIFIKEEVDDWLNNLKKLFSDEKSEMIYPLFVQENPQFSVYLEEKPSAELPIGSFAYKNGLFIPVPPYINKSKKLVEFHWIYKQGMWDGSSWHDQYFPRIPTFIRSKGTTDKIYQENNGYWFYDVSRHWIFYNTRNIVSVELSIPEKLSNLNRIKIDVNILIYSNLM